MRFLTSALFSVVAFAATMASAAPTLIMVEQDGCYYCKQWEAEIGPAYPNTAEGRFAPLQRANIRAGAPEGVTYARRVSFTPTFILVDEGTELARIEGYPGDDFFWPLLTKLLKDHTDFHPELSGQATN